MAFNLPSPIEFVMWVHFCDDTDVIVVGTVVPGDNVDSFLEDLNDDVSSALLELQKLEEDKDKSVKAEELFEICDALYKSNEDGIRKLELQLQQYGYTPGMLGL